MSYTLLRSTEIAVPQCIVAAITRADTLGGQDNPYPLRKPGSGQGVAVSNIYKKIIVIVKGMSERYIGFKDGSKYKLGVYLRFTI